MKVTFAPDYSVANPYQRLLAAELRRRGFEVSLTSSFAECLKKGMRRRGTRILHLHWPKWVVQGETAFVFFIRAFFFLLGLILLRLFGTRIVWTLHNEMPHDARHLRLENAFYRALCRVSSSVIVFGRAGEAIVQNKLGGDPQKIVQVSHGHYQNIYAPAVIQKEARDALELPEDGRIFLFFGLIRTYKGVEDLLEVWRRWENSESWLVIAGGIAPNMMEEFPHRVQATPRCLYRPDYVPDEKVHLHLSAADFLVLPYRRVLTSGSVLLGVTYGKPVIAPRLGEIPEALEGAEDLLYEPGHSEGLLKSLRRAEAMTEAERSDLSRRTARLTEKNDWASIGQKHSRLFASLLRTPAIPPVSLGTPARNSRAVR